MKNLRLYVSVSVLVIALLVGSLFLAIKPNKALAYAPTEVSTELLTPNSYLEYYNLTSPSDVYMDNEVTAVVEGNKNIVVFYDGNYTLYTDAETSFSNIIGIKRYSDSDYLILQDDLKLYSFNFKTGEKSALSLDGSVFTSDYFAFNDKYFINVVNTSLRIYSVTFDNGEFAFEYIATSLDVAKQPVAINSSNEFFYVVGTTLYKKTIGGILDAVSIKDEVTLSSAASISAASGYVYYSDGSKINYVETATLDSGVIIPHSDTMALGTTYSPMGISLKGNKLYVTDTSLNAVQEFTLSGKTATFTGRAITKTAEYESRLNGKEKKIASFGDTACILGTDKIKITDGKTYADYSLSTILANSDLMAFGGSSVMLASSGARKIAFFDIKSEDVTTISLSAVYIDATYSNGYYYLLMNESSIPTVVKFDLDGNMTTVIENAESAAAGDMIDVSVDGDVYLYSKYYGKIYRYQNGMINRQYNDVNDVLDIETDLNGNLFLLKADNVITFLKEDESENSDYLLKLNDNLTINGELYATDFSVDFATKKVFLLFEEDGLILSTNQLPNDNIVDSLPQNVVTTDVNAEEVLKVVSASGNLFRIEVTEDEISYTGTVETAENKNLLYLGENENFYTVTDGKIYIVKKSQSVVAEAEMTVKSFNAFVATKVNMYYLPVMTVNDDFKLKDAGRLEKGAKLTVSGEFDFEGKSFYFATYKDGTINRVGYVPKTFVSLTPVFDEVAEVFSFKTINGTKKTVYLYADFELTEKVFEINEKLTVKYFETKDNKALIELDYEGVTYRGYVEESAIEVPGRHAFRNSAIVILVMCAVLATSLYFILRQKNN